MNFNTSIELLAKYTPVTWAASFVSLAFGIFKLLRENTQWKRDKIAEQKEQIELNKLKNGSV